MGKLIGFIDLQEEFLDVIYWGRQIVALIIGVIWGYLGKYFDSIDQKIIQSSHVPRADWFLWYFNICNR